MENPLHLFSLCEDVRIEIFKYCNKEDMGNMSLTSKFGYEITKDYFENKTILSFSRPLTLQEINNANKLNRKHKIVRVVMTIDNDIILTQLAHIKITPNIIKYVGRYTEVIVRKSLNFVKEKFKIENISFEIGGNENLIIIDCEKDIDDFYKDPYHPKNITSLNISLDTNKPFTDQVKLFHRTIEEFSNLKALAIECCGFGEVWPGLIPDHEKVKYLQKLTIIHRENLISLNQFKNLHTIELTYCTDLNLLQTLLNNNKSTLKTLKVNYYDLVNTLISIPCQLNTLKVTTVCERFTEYLLQNQNELEFLELTISFTPKLLELLESHGSTNLDVRYSSYNDSPFKGNLTKVKYLTTNHRNFVKFIPIIENLVSLKIICDCYGTEEEMTKDFNILSGFQLRKLITLDITDLDYGLLHKFADIKLRLPALEVLRCNFNWNLLQEYPTLKSLTVWVSSLDDVMAIVDYFKHLEKLEVNVVADLLVEVVNFFKIDIFQNNLKFITISSFSNPPDRVKNIQDMAINDLIFCNFDDEDNSDGSYLGITVEIDIQTKELMYTLLKEIQ
ncbi:hypothetical protein ACFFRR_001709 [Megaselia abdita]